MTQEIMNKIIGNNIKRYRIEGGYSIQDALAKKVGVCRSTITALESPNNPGGVSPYVLYKISRELGKTMDDFFI